MADWQIQNAIQKGSIKIDPFDSTLINPNSMDVRLGNDFKFNKSSHKILDVYNNKTFVDRFDEITFDDSDEVIIEPGQNCLATTLETITLPNNVCAILEGKSSLARIFLEIHKTGGYIDAGFSGEITLEMHSEFKDPIRLYIGMPIGQLVFFEIAPAAIPYGEKHTSKYQNQRGATQSAYFKNIRGV